MTKKFILKNAKGFTMVELMVVVAVIGVLSAVSLPMFKKYMEKSKMAEGKLQLATAYIAMHSFYASYGMFANCLNYMGYNPMAEINNRYYAVGFYDTTTINDDAYTTATKLGLNKDKCPQGMDEKFASSSADDLPTQFSAGKGAGSLIIDTQDEFEAAEGAETWMIQDQSSDKQTFVIGTVGSIASDIDEASEASSMSINTNKFLRIHQNGY